MFVENTAAYLADFGVPASWTPPGQTVAIDAVVLPPDEPDEGVLGDRALSTAYAIEFRTADLPGLASGQNITVNGSVYEVIDVKKIDDGVFSRAALEV